MKKTTNATKQITTLIAGMTNSGILDKLIGPDTFALVENYKLKLAIDKAIQASTQVIESRLYEEQFDDKVIGAIAKGQGIELTEENLQAFETLSKRNRIASKRMKRMEDQLLKDVAERIDLVGANKTLRVGRAKRNLIEQRVVEKQVWAKLNESLTKIHEGIDKFCFVMIRDGKFEVIGMSLADA